MESYILRIYRRAQDGDGQMLGTLEDMRGAGKMAFKNFEELRDILYKGGRDHWQREGW